MSKIKSIILAATVLLSFAAQAEIYKYVDDQGNIHFTDDLNQVPVEQRDSIETSFEYEGEVDSEIEATEGEIDPELASSNEDSAEQATGFTGETGREESVALLEDRQQEGDAMDSADNTDDQLDLAAQRKQLEDLKKEIDAEYQALVQERAKLDQEKESLENREDILKFNAKVDRLNKRAQAYEQKGKKYQEQVDAYNEYITRQNAKINKKATQKK